MLKEPFFVERESSESCQSPASASLKADSNNTLGSLTKKFVELIKTAPDETIEIHEASEKLCIQKRRIYDITNVLEGIGYIQKLGKNQMKWVGGTKESELQKEARQLELKSEKLDRETKKLQDDINRIKDLLLEQTKRHCKVSYICADDIRSIMRSTKRTKILLYSGGIGDQLEVDSNSQTKISRSTIESYTSTSRLYICTEEDGETKEEAEQNGEEEEEEEQPRVEKVLYDDSDQDDDKIEKAAAGLQLFDDSSDEKEEDLLFHQ